MKNPYIQDLVTQRARGWGVGENVLSYILFLPHIIFSFQNNWNSFNNKLILTMCFRNTGLTTYIPKGPSSPHRLGVSCAGY